MIVEGRSIFLRTVRTKDLDWLYERDCDIEARGMYFPVILHSEAEFKSEFQETGYWTDSYGQALICDNQDQSILGIMYYFKTTPYWDSYEVGARLFDLQNANRGIMSEALPLFTYVLFMTYKINRVELKITPQNALSKRVAVKCGYQYEGIARGGVFLRGSYQDMEVYSILRREAPSTLAEAVAMSDRQDKKPGVEK